MSWHDKIFIVVWLLVFIIVQAKWQRDWFDENKPSGYWWHFWQGALYGVAMCIIIPFGVFCGWVVAIKMIVLGMLERAALFFWILNLMRGRSFFYNGYRTTTSSVDYIENELSFFWRVVLKISYMVAFILAFIFIH